MKKTPILLILALLCSVGLYGQNIKITFKKKPVTVIDWMSPLTKDDLRVTDNMLDIKLRIVVSDEDIKTSDINIHLNGEPVTKSKAGEVSLTKTSRSHEYSYSDKVALQPGKNEIQVSYMRQRGQGTLWSIPKYISFNNDEANIEAPPEAISAGINYIYWLDPDITELENKAIAQQERELVFRQKILTTEKGLKKDKIIVYHNNKILDASPKSTLRKVGEGEYIFKEHLQLTDTPNPNWVYVDFKTSKRTYRTKAGLRAEFSSEKPNVHILAVGTSTNLQYTEDDAFDFGSIYSGQEGVGMLFNEANPSIISGDKASAANIKKAVEKLKKHYDNRIIAPDDLIIVFISSHGFIYDNELRIQASDYDPGTPESTSVCYERDIIGILDKIPCKKILFIDACHSGAGGAKSNPADLNYQIKKIIDIKEGISVLVSSQKDESSYEDEKWQNGAFTEAIIQGLKNGQADLTTRGNQDGFVTIEELYAYVKTKVPEMVGETKRQAQHPIMLGKGLGDIAIYVY